MILCYWLLYVIAPPVASHSSAHASLTGNCELTKVVNWCFWGVIYCGTIILEPLYPEVRKGFPQSTQRAPGY